MFLERKTGKCEKGREKMFDKIDQLAVYMDDKRVGRLAMNEQRLCVFEYDRNWLRDGFSISPFHLPLERGVFTAPRDPFNGLFGVFNDSLPDGWGNLLVDRWLKENGVNPSHISWLERLSIVGNSGMGALRYEPEVEKGKSSAAKSLTFYADEVSKILREEEVESLDHWIERAGSPGGARPKILFEKEGVEWLIKFGAIADPSDIGEIEFEYAQTAMKSGIEMSNFKLFEGKYFGSVRFDRENGGRIHMVTASGLLHASHRYPSLDYSDLMKATFHLTQSINEVKKLYRLMVFNVLTFNQDDHAKNFSFLCKNGKWVCAPAYDLVFSSGFNGNHSTTVNGKGKPSREDFYDAGEIVGISRKECEIIANEVEVATSMHKIRNERN